MEPVWNPLGVDGSPARDFIPNSIMGVLAVRE
jgi:hypothetical protein